MIIPRGNASAGPSGSPVEIVEVLQKRDLDAFIGFPLSLYRNDPLYAPQLRRDMRIHFSRKNPFLRSADVKFFLAMKDGRVSGRIACVINHHHIELHHERAGFFGFFESVNDRGISGALLGRVCGELRDRGLEVMRGPMNFSTNEECGILIDGFANPPMLLTPYNPPYYPELLEDFGMAKAKDLYAFVYSVQDALPEKVLRVAAIAEKRGVSVRPADKRHFVDYMRAFKEVYNSAWHRNWGFLPLTDDELLYSAERLKPLVVPDLILIAEERGGPVGFLGLIPDYNSVLRHLRGKLTPLSLIKALYYSRRITGLRLLLLGIKEEYRNRGVDALLFREGYKGIRRGNYKTVEFSWILEDNIPVIRIVEMFGGQLYKKYRIYERRIER